MLGQDRSIFNDDFKGIPEEYIEGPKNFNAIWGREYFIYMRKGLKEDTIDALIDDIMFFHAIKT